MFANGVKFCFVFFHIMLSHVHLHFLPHSLFLSQEVIVTSNQKTYVKKSSIQSILNFNIVENTFNSELHMQQTHTVCVWGEDVMSLISLNCDIIWLSMHLLQRLTDYSRWDKRGTPLHINIKLTKYLLQHSFHLKVALVCTAIPKHRRGKWPISMVQITEQQKIG